MPRANRYYQKGYVWHLTHRCHQREFLLRFDHDRRQWRQWLFEARKRYGLSVLNYIATSNHIHILVRDQGKGEIASSMQLISGRVAQQYNRRRNRKGAFWTDRYHATAVGGMEHLLRCWTYIDLNMVRAGVVDHPSDWPVCGYNELQATPQRYRILDIDALLDVFNLQDHTSLQCLSREQVAVQLQNKRPERQPEWTESIAIGNEGFVRTLYRQFGPRALHLSIDREGDTYQLKDEPFALEP